MCIGNRNAPSSITIGIIRNVFTTVAPSSATGYFVLLFISVSIILLGVTLLPEIFIYETDFTDLNIVSRIGNTSIQEVSKISWGTWRVCAATINSSKPICTKDDWISNPYQIIIENGDGVQASVQKLWNRVLFLQLVGLIFAVFLVFVLWMRMYCLARKSRRYNRDSVAGLTRGVEPEKERVCNLSNFLTFFLWVWVTIVVIGNGVVLKSIQTEMQSLGRGVTTNPTLGFWLPVAANGFTLVTAALFVLFIKTNVHKSQEMVITQT